MATETLTRKVTLKIMECGSCGIAFALPETLYNKCYKEGGYWFCPLGHSRGWEEKNCENEADKLRSKIASLESNISYKNNQIEAERKRASAAKGQLTKERNRVANGVCPCCNRTFQNLHRHMANKHPEFAEKQTD